MAAFCQSYKTIEIVVYAQREPRRDFTTYGANYISHGTNKNIIRSSLKQLSFRGLLLMLTLFKLSSPCKSYKTFYARNLRMSLISQSVCSWQTFSAQYNVCGPTQLEHLNLPHPLYSGCLYTQTKDQPGKTCQGQHSSLLRTFSNYGRKKFLKNWTLAGKPSWCNPIIVSLKYLLG